MQALTTLRTTPLIGYGKNSVNEIGIRKIKRMRSDRTDRAISIIIMALVVLAMLFFSSCNPLKNVNRENSKTSTKFSDQSVIETNRPGDEIIILPYPRTPNERLKDTIVVYLSLIH